ncbi:MAG: type I DNA topoisomerase [Nitrospirota bacterium]|nr:type I DNA topoisomerase [Nitrospirota bacterium]
MKLVIVESPTKARHISHMLGTGWEVMASVGHIRDLALTGPESHVRPPDFRLTYVVSDSKKEVVAKLRSAARSAGEIFLATDPDREGEAIAWHLAEVLKLKNPKRITYQEVTETAVRKALASPRTLDENLIAAQEVRRGLDRMIGWEVSGVLSDSLGKQGMSAGRVQTPAIRLIVEREREIRKFRSVDHYGVFAHFGGGWKASWESGEDHFLDRAFAERLATAVPGLSFRVTEASKSVKNQSPPPPFTTSTLQKTASKRLSLGLEEVMKLAQSLFEQGLITYHRTDSPNLSSEGETLIRQEASRRGIALSEKPRRWKSKEGAQEAHEAIRPTDMTKDSAGRSGMEKELYELVWKRAMASQSADARFIVTNAQFDAGNWGGRALVFRATGSRLDFPGWKTVYGVEEDEEETEAANPVPVLERGETKKAERGELQEKKTKPPARYTQSTLVDVLEKREIGRPSTYASIVKVLFSRDYIREEKKSLIPTSTGEAVVDALSGRFQFADVDYTKTVEAALDDVAGGKKPAIPILRKVWEDLQSNLKGLAVRSAGQTDPGGKFTEKTPVKRNGPPCPKCGKSTGEMKTKTNIPYFRCPEGHGPWWSDKGKIGKEWAPWSPQGPGSKATGSSLPAKGKNGLKNTRSSGVPKKRGVR